MFAEYLLFQMNFRSIYYARYFGLLDIASGENETIICRGKKLIEEKGEKGKGEGFRRP